MYVNKISGLLSDRNFKGHQHIINNVGKQVEKFGYPYDAQTQTCEIEFVRVKRNEKYNVILDKASKRILQMTPDGLTVDPQKLLNLDEGEAYAYKIRIREKDNPSNVIWEGADTGVKIKKLEGDECVFKTADGRNNDNSVTEAKPEVYEKDKDGNVIMDNGKPRLKNYSYPLNSYSDDLSHYEYTLMTTHGTTPMSNGAGYLAMPDTLMPGAKFRGFDDANTGEVYIDEAAQKKAETALRTFSNIMGGGIAGLIASVPYLKESGYRMLFTTPIANGDDVSSHSYWNKNNMQIASRMGNTENFAELMRETYKNGIQYVYDGTFTSEGLEGIHFQYALRWAQKNPQTYYWFRMNGLKNSNLGLGVIPENAKNLSHRIVNAPYNYEKQSNGTYKKVPNKQYNPNKETLFQIYDASQVSEAQKNALDKQIRVYENIVSGNPMDINTHDDTLIAYAFQINPNEYDDRINAINKLVKSGEKVDLYSEKGTVLAGQFSSFKIDKKTEGGFVAWDANTDMVKMNYGISGYDLKNLRAMTDRAQRYHEQQMIERGSKEVQDMAIQAGKYWTGVVKDVETLYTAKTIGTLKSADSINNLIKEGKLPDKAEISEEKLTNILNGEFIFERRGILDKDSVTVKSLMKLPMDALEFGENTAGVLATSYFSNRATTDETIGKTRFELLKANNPHIVGEYAGVYNKVNSMFTNELKDFANKVIDEVNSSSNEKLLDSSGNFTEYGEYVMELVGRDIAKYALLKSLAGENFRTKVMNNGDLTYDYDKIKENTTLKKLGINASNPKEEAELLQKRFQKGLKNLNDEDVSNVAKSISQRISGTDTMSFRLSEAIVNQASNGLAWRLDAAKDVMDQDAVRNKENDFDDTWNNMIKFWKQFVQGVKSENPNAYIVAEITDVPELLRDTYGMRSVPYDGKTNVNDCKFNGDVDAQTKFFTETGITSEAGYSYLFTNLLVNFSGEFESGNFYGGENHDAFKDRVDILMQNRSADYLRNLYTFIGNHDKTRTIQGLAVDMRLFQSPITYSYDNNGVINYGSERDQRQKVIQILSGAKSPDSVPIELRLNVDNMDYFRTISPKAVSQAKALLLPVREDLNGIASKDEIEALSNAIIDLANGNYKLDKNTNYMTRIDISELSTLEKTISQILDMCEKHGMTLTAKARKELEAKILNEANTIDFSSYLVHGDFTMAAPNDGVANENRKYLQEILGSSNDGSSYSLYTVQLARLVRDAYKKANTKDSSSAMDEALKDFINKYNRSFVESKTKEAVKFESVEITRNKDSFGVKPFENVMDWVINQAEFKTGKKFKNRKAVINRVVTSITEPAIQKQAMMLTYLKGLIGIPTVFAGDEYGASGYEDKAKNKYLNPRNTVNRNCVNAERYSKYTNDTIKDRIDKSLHSLNDGTPYAMDIMVGKRNRDGVRKRLAEIDKEIDLAGNNQRLIDKLLLEKRQLSKELAKIAYMMYSANGDAVVSVFSAADVNQSNRFDYYDYIAREYGIDTEAKRKKAFADGTLYSMNPDNKYVPIQHKTEMDAILLGAGVTLPIGTIFMNANARDKVVYEVRRIGSNLGIVRKDGKKIIMDAITAKNGVMLLKKIKNVIFKGNTAQYNFVSNPYKVSEQAQVGSNLSIAAV